MRSLRSRLLIVLMLALLAFWAIWLGCQYLQMNRDRTGSWDAMMQSIGNQILTSLPRGIEALSAEATFALPAQAPFAGDRLSFQLWTRAGDSIMRSPGAPAVPFRPDFRDGFSQTQIDGESWRVYAVSDANGHVQVQVAKAHRMLVEEKLRWLRLSLQTALLIFVILAIVIWTVVRWSLRPVDAVEANLHRRGPLDLTPLPDAGLPAEIRPLVVSFNRQLERLDHAMQIERRFIADAAHELRTPLAALSAHAELALRADDPEQARVAIGKLSEVVARSTRLSEQLLDLARLDAGETAAVFEPVDLSKLVAIVLRDFETLAQRRRQRITLEVDTSRIAGDIDLIGILIRNLIDNALRHSGEGSRIVVRCRPARADGRALVELCVADDGPGVPEAERARIFERFYRAEGNGRSGSGIGLSLVARIAARHGATVESGVGLDGRGLMIAVRFPALD